MDDWSLLPRRNAVSEPAPNHQSPVNPTNSQTTARLDPPRQAPPPSAKEHPCSRKRRLTRQAEPGNSATKPGAEPRNPLLRPRIPMTTTPIPHTNIKNGQPPLDNTRPFMDDVQQHPAAVGDRLDRTNHEVPRNGVERRHDRLPTSMASRRRSGSCARVTRWRAARLSWRAGCAAGVSWS